MPGFRNGMPIFCPVENGSHKARFQIRHECGAGSIMMTARLSCLVGACSQSLPAYEIRNGCRGHRDSAYALC